MKMKTKIHTQLISMVLLSSCSLFLLAACGQTAPTPTALPGQTSTPAPASTATPSPAPSATITLTPFPTLSGNKPYLMIRQDNENQSFSIYDTAGGRKLVGLPPDGHIKGI